MNSHDEVNEPIVESICPRCGQIAEADPCFGLVIHEACGWCSHISRTGGRCELCGDIDKGAGA